MRYVETRVVLVKLGDGWARKLGEVVEAMNVVSLTHFALPTGVV